MQDGKVRELPGVRKRALGLLRVALVVGALAAGSTLAPNAAATGMVYPSEAGPLRVTEVARGLDALLGFVFRVAEPLHAVRKEACAPSRQVQPALVDLDEMRE